MRVRRGYLVALLVVALGAAWSVTHSSADSAGADPYLRIEQGARAQARRGLPEAMAALAGVRVPPGAHPLTRGCHWYRCYLIEKPTAQAASVLLVIMRSLGATLKGIGARTGPTKLAGCDDGYNRVHGRVAICAESAVIDENVVSVFLGPYLGCPPRACRWTGETEVEITFPSGKPA